MSEIIVTIVFQSTKQNYLILPKAVNFSFPDDYSHIGHERG